MPRQLRFGPFARLVRHGDHKVTQRFACWQVVAVLGDGIHEVPEALALNDGERSDARTNVNVSYGALTWHVC